MNHLAHLRSAVVAALAALLLVPGTAFSAGGGLMYPDDRDVHSPAAIQASQSADIAPDDRVAHHPVTLTAPIAAQASVGDGFDWVDAGIGAASVFGLGLVGAGAFVLVLRRRRTAFA